MIRLAHNEVYGVNEYLYYSSLAFFHNADEYLTPGGPRVIVGLLLMPHVAHTWNSTTDVKVIEPLLEILSEIVSVT